MIDYEAIKKRFTLIFDPQTFGLGLYISLPTLQMAKPDKEDTTTTFFIVTIQFGWIKFTAQAKVWETKESLYE